LVYSNVFSSGAGGQHDQQVADLARHGHPTAGKRKREKRARPLQVFSTFQYYARQYDYKHNNKHNNNYNDKHNNKHINKHNNKHDKHDKHKHRHKHKHKHNKKHNNKHIKHAYAGQLNSFTHLKALLVLHDHGVLDICCQHCQYVNIH
jgi:hypothetical protein